MLKAKYGKDVVFDKKYGQKQPPDARLLLAVRHLQDLGRAARPGRRRRGRRSPRSASSTSTGRSPWAAARHRSSARRRPRRSKIRKALDEAARDDSIKAVVLRVNSPGGSAVASEIILDATRRVKAKKPFVVSMGDVAGSGGYYVACASDIIFADESTITASIGVVGGKLATTDDVEEGRRHLQDLQAGRERRHARLRRPVHAGRSASGCRPGWTRSTTCSRATSGRSAATGSRSRSTSWPAAGSSPASRRWSWAWSTRSAACGDAIAHVAGEAKLTDYDVRVVPAPKNFLEQLIEEASGAGDDAPGLDLRDRPTAGRPRLAGGPGHALSCGTSTRPASPRSRRPSGTSSCCNARASCS